MAVITTQSNKSLVPDEFIKGKKKQEEEEEEKNKFIFEEDEKRPNPTVFV